MSNLTGIPLSLVTGNQWDNYRIEDSKPNDEGKTFKTMSIDIHTEGWGWLLRRVGSIALVILGVATTAGLLFAIEGYRNLTSFLWNDKIVQPLTRITTDAEKEATKLTAAEKDGKSEAEIQNIEADKLIQLELEPKSYGLLKEAASRSYEEIKACDDEAAKPDTAEATKRRLDTIKGHYETAQRMFPHYALAMLRIAHPQVPAADASNKDKFEYWLHFAKEGLYQEHINLLEEACRAGYAPAKLYTASLFAQNERTFVKDIHPKAHGEIQALTLYSELASMVVPDDEPAPPATASQAIKEAAAAKKAENAANRQAVAKATAEKASLIAKYTADDFDAEKQYYLAISSVLDKATSDTLIEKSAAQQYPFAMVVRGNHMLAVVPADEEPEARLARLREVRTLFFGALAKAYNDEKNVADGNLYDEAIRGIDALFTSDQTSIAGRYTIIEKLATEFENYEHIDCATKRERLHQEVEAFAEGVSRQADPDEKARLLAEVEHYPDALQYDIANALRNENETEAAFAIFTRLDQARDRVTGQLRVNLQYQIARCYQGGVGVDENRQQALTYYALAAGQGHEAARDGLRALYEAIKQENARLDADARFSLTQEAAQSILGSLTTLPANAPGGAQPVVPEAGNEGLYEWFRSFLPANPNPANA